jgi:hypothetical protein
MPEQPKWMPVFVVLPATAQAFATVNEEDSSRRVHTNITRPGKDFWQRVGTAYLQPDGSLSVQLTAMPVNGKLVIRPPHAGENLDPTKQGEE